MHRFDACPTRAGRKDVSAIRAHNERRLRFERASGAADPIPLVCECPDPRCLGAVLVTASRAQAAHSRPGQHLVIPGHLGSDLEVVVERHDRCWVVAPPQFGGPRRRIARPRFASMPSFHGRSHG